jgi:hypothetical protein
MKVTPNAAMRARDVSRPHAEHLARAEAADADATRVRGADPEGTADGACAATARVDPVRADPVPGKATRAARPKRTRRRRMPRGPAERG